MASYSTRDPKGWCGDPSRGAALGRATFKGDARGQISVARVHLDSGGYDRNGTYFGAGRRKLFWVSDESGEVDYVFRAVDMSSACAEVSKGYPSNPVTAGPDLLLKCAGVGFNGCPDDNDAVIYSEHCEECEHEQILVQEGYDAQDNYDPYEGHF